MDAGSDCGAQHVSELAGIRAVTAGGADGSASAAIAGEGGGNEPGDLVRPDERRSGELAAVAASERGDENRSRPERAFFRDYDFQYHAIPAGGGREEPY